MTEFVAPKPPTVTGLEGDGVTPRGKSALASGVYDPFDFKVGQVEEGLQLLESKGTFLRTHIGILDVPGLVELSRCEGALVEGAEVTPGLQSFPGPAVAGLGYGLGLVEGAFDLLDGGAVACCVAGGVADQALAAEDPGGDGERLDRHWARFSPRLPLPEDMAARVRWCSSAA
ncbi:hypothetical protein [Arthrobacter sp. NyZ413]|uniref:hypothetical protein n=1 Tax=Arthrobacter sp. NyZ413 TaxID=3144669 RepID=UPI003BF82147